MSRLLIATAVATGQPLSEVSTWDARTLATVLAELGGRNG